VTAHIRLNTASGYSLIARSACRPADKKAAGTDVKETESLLRAPSTEKLAAGNGMRAGSAELKAKEFV
jgi:hypothetical protein